MYYDGEMYSCIAEVGRRERKRRHIHVADKQDKTVTHRQDIIIHLHVCTM